MTEDDKYWNVDPKSGASLVDATASGNKPPLDDGGNRNVCLRASLILYSIVLLLLGCAAMYLGVWLFQNATGLIPIVGDPFIQTAILSIVVGVALSVLAVCGCFGSIRKHRRVLLCFGSTLGTFVIFVCVTLVLQFIYRNEFISGIMERMRDGLKKQYGVDTESEPENKYITELWDLVQQQIGCCGISKDDREPWAYYSRNTLWYKEIVKRGRGQKVPDSCCIPEGDIAVCTGQTNFAGPPNYRNQRYRNMTNPHLYTNDCYDLLTALLLKTFNSVLGAGYAIVLLILVIGVIIAYCLHARVGGASPDQKEEQLELAGSNQTQSMEAET
ncbi:CD151 antigen-like [Haliotis cracherodii]|uniref:CD151 antigen-like n=1 Tax=Haliotis cracherodii TaxID=6455 RepID=UPI0039E85A64